MSEEFLHFVHVSFLRNRVVLCLPILHDLGLLIRIAIISDVFEFRFIKNAHTDTFDLVIHLAMDASAS